jgi:hypothetical protein
MAHYAYLDNNNIVVDVIVGKDETELIDGLHPEIYYAQGTPYTVKRTSYNGNIRKQYCGVGYSYNAEADVFVAPQPFASWSLDENFDWQAPVARPTDDKFYTWSEDDLTWKEVVND